MPGNVETNAIKRDKRVIFMLPIIIGIVAGFILRCIGVKNGFDVPKKDGLEDIKIMLGIWGTLLGFMITAVSILVALGNDRFINILRETGHFTTILYSYSLCCIHLLFAVIWAIIIIFAKYWSFSLFYVLCGLTIDTLVIVAICLLFLLGIINRVNKTQS